MLKYNNFDVSVCVLYMNYNANTIRTINEMLVYMVIYAEKVKNSKRAITPLYNRLRAFWHRIWTHGIWNIYGYIDHIEKILENHGFLVWDLIEESYTIREKFQKHQIFKNSKFIKLLGIYRLKTMSRLRLSRRRQSLI